MTPYRISAVRGLLLAVTGCWVAAGWAGAGQPDLLAQGAELYRNNCMNCHGETAVGDGPMTEVLRIPPADLTRLSAGNAGDFPLDRVYSTIDGRESIRGHGSRRMPIWGLTFQQLDRDTDQEPEVRRRIEALIEYLRSIQKPD